MNTNIDSERESLALGALDSLTKAVIQQEGSIQGDREIDRLHKEVLALFDAREAARGAYEDSLAVVRSRASLLDEASDAYEACSAVYLRFRSDR